MTSLDKSGSDKSTEQRLRGYLQNALAETMPRPSRYRDLEVARGR
jgi:hypothetical protein